MSHAVEIVEVDLAEVLLDPNSYRLIDDPWWERVRDDHIPRPEVQAGAFEAIVEGSRARLAELRASMRVHGWLHIEPLRVRRLADGRLVVVDGNRRVAAWRLSRGARPHQAALFADPGAHAKAVAILVDDADEAACSAELGLRHILPPSPWPSLGVALWREAHQRTHGEAPDDGDMHRLRRYTPEAEGRALRLVRELGSRWPLEDGLRLYSLVVEALRHRPVRAWVDAADPDLARQRGERLLEWLAPAASDEDGWGVSDDEQSPDPTRPLRLTDLRSLAALLADPAVVKVLDAGAHPAALLASGAARGSLGEPSEYLHPWVDAQIARQRRLDPALAQAAMVRLREAIVRAGEQPVEAGSAHPWPLLERAAAAPLRSLTLSRYRGLAGVALPELKRVNLLVGVNNAGKTSILEAIYLLARLSDPRGLLDTLRVRTRQDPERDPSLLSTLLAGLEVEVQAVDAGERPLSVKLSRLPVVEGADLATQLPGMRLEATVDGGAHATTTELFSRRPRRTVQVAGASAWLAPAVLHSPYAPVGRAELMRCYERSVEEGALGTILAAVREAVDPGIEDLRMVSEGGRFVVQHRHRGPMDISSYGEGLQRVFEIGLLFAAHRGGLVLIDELETAIHPSAMIRFTKLVHELAVRFDVQVFITTHSKETVDSFLFNDYEVSEVAAYVLKQRPEGGVEVRRFAGPQLRRAVEVGDVDLRWL